MGSEIAVYKFAERVWFYEISEEFLTEKGYHFVYDLESLDPNLRCDVVFIHLEYFR